MLQLNRIPAFLAMALFCAASNAETTIVRSFDGIENIHFSSSSGDTIVRKSSNDQVTATVRHTYPEGVLTPVFQQDGAMLQIKEEFSRRWSVRGRARWTLEVPDGIDLKFASGSGDLTITNVNIGLKSSFGSGDVTLKKVTGNVKISEGSGSIELEDVTGDVRISEGSGDVELQDVRGDVRISEGSGSIEIENLEGTLNASTGSGRIYINGATGDMSLNAGSGRIKLNAINGAVRVDVGSGNITARAMKIAGASSFSSGSGNAVVGLASRLDHDIRIETGSGTAELDFNGSPISGEIEMRANTRHGRISAPLDFDKEYEERYGHDTYMVRQAKIGDSEVQISVSSETGHARIRR